MNIPTPAAVKRLLFHESVSREQRIGWIALGVNILSVSTVHAFAKHLTGSISSLTLLLIAQSLIAVFVFLSFGSVPIARSISRLSVRSLWPLLIVGLIGGFLAPMSWFFGLTQTTAVNAALFSRSEMLFLLLAAVLFLGEPWSRGHVVGSIIILVGILLISVEGFQTSLTLGSGDVLVLLSGALYALGALIFRTRLHGIPIEIVMLSRAMMGVVCFFLLSPLLGINLTADIANFPTDLLPTLLGFCFISQFVNLFSFYEAVDRLPVSTVSLFLTLGVVGSVLFANMWLGEAILWYHIAGGACIVLGTVALEVLGVHPSKAQHEEHLVQERTTVS